MVESLIAPELNRPATDPRTAYQCRFHEARAVAGASLKDVAVAAGVSIAAVSQFERGLSSMSLPVLLAACAFLGTRAGWVLEGEGRMLAGARRVPTVRGGRRAARNPV